MDFSQKKSYNVNKFALKIENLRFFRTYFEENYYN